jgi:hypothetical protein
VLRDNQVRVLRWIVLLVALATMTAVAAILLLTMR